MTALAALVLLGYGVAVAAGAFAYVGEVGEAGRFLSRFSWALTYLAGIAAIVSLLSALMLAILVLS